MGSHLPQKAPGSSQLWGHLSHMVPSVPSERHPGERVYCLLQQTEAWQGLWERNRSPLNADFLYAVCETCMCVFPLTTHIAQGKAFKTRIWNRSCVTHSPATPSCMLTRNPRQCSVRRYIPSTIIAASDPKGKPTLYTYNHTYELKASQSTARSPLNGCCSTTMLRRSGSADCSGSSGMKQLRGPAPSGVQSTGLAACKD